MAAAWGGLVWATTPDRCRPPGHAMTRLPRPEWATDGSAASEQPCPARVHPSRAAGPSKSSVTRGPGAAAGGGWAEPIAASASSAAENGRAMVQREPTRTTGPEVMLHRIGRVAHVSSGGVPYAAGCSPPVAAELTAGGGLMK